MNAAFETITLSAGECAAEVVPARGGIITRFRVGEVAVLYCDQATVDDASGNVRGGIPILFPTAGRLVNDLYGRYGSRPMKQHGFARNLAWSVLGRDQGSIVLGLDSSEATLAQFPFAFHLEYEYVVQPHGALRIRQRYDNLGAEPMPLHQGFHPYFAVADAEKSRARIPTAATRAFDNTTRQEIAFAGFDLTRREVDLHLVDHGASHATLVRPDGRRVEIVGSAEYSRWVVWTLAGKDFVCLEPWTAPANALNSGDGLIHIPPGSHRDLELTISLADH